MTTSASFENRGLAWLGLVASAVFALAGCSPQVGSHCNTNTDCSLQGTLVCDTSQPNGYCTLFNCAANTCPNSASCVLLDPAIPGCPYDDYQSPVRTARSVCLEHCDKNSDCRSSEGYVCVDPTQYPWNALIIDDNQGQKVCMQPADYIDGGIPEGGLMSSYDAEPAVCQRTGPTLTPIDAAVTYTFPNTGSDAAGE